MDRMKKLLPKPSTSLMASPTTTTTSALSFLFCFSLCSSLVSALPTSINLRSANRGFIMNSNAPSNRMHLADGILCDLMMLTGDRDRDNKLSASEIAWFYRNVVNYSDYVANTYGHSFIAIADINEQDGLLDRDELLRMLIAMDESDHMRR